VSTGTTRVFVGDSRKGRARALPLSPTCSSWAVELLLMTLALLEDPGPEVVGGLNVLLVELAVRAEVTATRVGLTTAASLSAAGP